MHPDLNPDGWIETRWGTRFSVVSPKLEDIKMTDIVWSLSQIARFGGHTSRFYSVAQHSIEVALRVIHEQSMGDGFFRPICEMSRIVREAILHDAAEAYLGDIPSPIKRHLPDYRKLERRLDAAIRERFDLPAEISPEIRVADLQALEAEANDLGFSTASEWGFHAQKSTFEREGYDFLEMNPAEVRGEFMAIFAASWNPNP